MRQLEGYSMVVGGIDNVRNSDCRLADLFHFHK